jgi:ACS family hexuronate transporter-like MFS transporter
MESTMQSSASQVRVFGAGRLRWMVCGMLFVATALNYADRQLLGILAEPLRHEFGWSESDYGLIVAAFTAAYAIGVLGFGPIIDRIGTRMGYALAVAWWSVAGALHAATSSVLAFGAARFLLGLGEAGNFPAAVKTVAEWFPLKERALAMGIFNCGSNVGAILVPLIVPWIVIHMGWRPAFLVTPLIGLCWVLGWLLLYRPATDHAWLTEEERRYIQSDTEEQSLGISWRTALLYRQTWAWCIARFLTDPVWWFFLYWIPKYLYIKQGMTLGRIGGPLVIIYLAADAGSIFGGWLSSFLLRRGRSVNAARKLAILVCALMVTPLALAANTAETWKAVLILSLATAGHQGWAANMFASISDMYPKKAVGSITGIAGFAGALGGMIVASVTGFTLQATGSYVPMFIYAGFSYLLILCILQLMIPRIEPIGSHAPDEEC